jgi:hypothetical protein
MILQEDARTIIPSNEGIAKCVVQLSINILLGLFQCNVHVAVYRL